MLQLKALRFLGPPSKADLGGVSGARALASVSPRDLDAAERALRSGEQRLREILEAVPVAFISSDAEGLVLDWNREAELIFGWTRTEALGRRLAEMVLPPPIQPAYDSEISELLESGDRQPQSRRIELTAARKDGYRFPVEITICRVSTPSGYLLRAYARDISAQRRADEDRRHAEEQLTYQALHDHCTGLPNRTLALDRVSHALSLAERHETSAAVLYADIDDFKLVNESFGHDVGDELLVRVARRIQDVLRGTDSVVRLDGDNLARVGGDEFVILCESLADERSAIDIAERVRSAFTEPFDIAGERLFVRLSIGIALTSASATAGSLIRDADAAMYQAKERGGGRYELFDADIRARVLGRIRKENELRDAIKRDQLRLYYQPIVSVLDGSIIGAEALLRWEHPEHGLIPPGEFIPIAEGSGLIVPIGRWVLEHAWVQLSEWQAELGYLSPLRMSVNISGRQVMDDDLVSVVTDLLGQHQPQPSQLILEVTESILLDDTDARVAVLQQLPDLGVRLALDDFGTGYSSLAYLRCLPFNVLKLDRTFITGLAEETVDRQIAAAVIEMARALTMTVIAEGVEQLEQLEFLRRLGCHFAQGYYFAPPMPAADFTSMLQGQSAAQRYARS